VTQFTLTGQVPSLKNGRIPVGNTTIPSKQYREWLPGAQLVAGNAHKGELFTGPVVVTVTTYGLMNDIDGAAQSIVEMMQGAVYENDRQVVVLHAERHKGPKKDRRCVVEVEEA
jgi:Holliday junction resolvase RusA-like endonuclease